MPDEKKTASVKVPRRILSSLLASVAAGVVPRAGAPYIAIGRDEELKALLSDFDVINDGGATFRFIIGKYGSGKSFLMQLVRCYALDKGFICADADLSPERRICGTKGTGRATYCELMKNLASKSSPDGKALPLILAKWMSDLQSKVVMNGTEFDSPDFYKKVENEMFSVIHELEGQIGSFDFAMVMSKYYKATVSGDDEKKSAVIRWLRGEFSTKTQAREQLGVSSIIDDANWYEYIKLFAVFFQKIGYNGFVVFIDECVNLYKIPNKISRENNYEKILSMFNDTLQCKASGLSVIMGGTPQFLEDTRRGLFSYEALRSRLYDGSFANAEYKNFIGPVIRLRRLSDDELYALIERITRLHFQFYGKELSITPEDKANFMKICLSRAGADSLITPREIIRDYMTVLNILLQNESATPSSVINKDVISLKHSAAGEAEESVSSKEDTAEKDSASYKKSDFDFNLEDIEI